MITTAVPTRSRAATDVSWLRLAQVSVVVAIAALLVFAYVGTFLTTISEGDFKYTADYFYTGVGLPIAAAGIGLTLAVHRLQHGRDGRLGMIGFWVGAAAMTELFVQLGASVLASAELRWGPAYVVCTALAFVGMALLAAGSWRTGLLPRWMLGVFPVVWIVGSFGAVGPTPLLLVAFLVALIVTLHRRVTRAVVDF